MEKTVPRSPRPVSASFTSPAPARPKTPARPGRTGRLAAALRAAPVLLALSLALSLALALALAHNALAADALAANAPSVDAQAQVPWPGRLVYRESSPRAEHLKQYDITRQGGDLLITLREKDVVQEIASRPGGETRRETYRNLRTGDRVEVARGPEGLAFSGSLGGRETRKTESCDASPWYGSVLLLRDFLLSGRETQAFHLTRAEETSLVTLEATRQGRETLSTALGPVEAVKVKMTLPGMKSWMWKSWYWFRASDGVLLRSEGTRGPASPVYVVELVEE